MKPVVVFLTLVVLAAGDSVRVVDGPVPVNEGLFVNGPVQVQEGPEDVPLENNPVYGYMARIGVPLAEKIRKAEEEMLKKRADDEDHDKSRIVGGIPSLVGEFPWQAGLITDIIGLNGNGVCGGTLVSPTRVITAAHCWYDGQYQAWRITIVLGSTYLFSGGLRVETSVMAMHPSWSPLLVRHDIGCLYMPLAVGSTDIIHPIALPFGYEDEDFVGQAAIISGYGLTTETGSITNTQSLHYAPVAVIRNTVCFISFPLIITNDHICTSGAGGIGTCGGDSGGPLVVYKNDKALLVGVTSFGTNAGCSSGNPAGYTRITSHLDFLRQHM